MAQATATVGDDLFVGPGEMRALCRAFDWSSTVLGPVAGWPLSLRTIVATLLASRQPMFLFWGPELVQIYNDAYRPSLAEGGRHPHALGMRGAEFWTDIWNIIGPQIAQVRAGGPATWHEDDLVPIERNGKLEEVYWTYCYGPAFDDDGKVGGVLVVCQETTSRVLTERRLQALNQELEIERSRLRYVFEQAPAFLAVLRGPPYVFEFANDAFYQVVGHRDLIGRPVFDAIPEARAQGFEKLLDGVVATGEPFVGREMRIFLSLAPDAPPEERLLDFVYFPLIDVDGSRGGVIAHGVDVTDHVHARRDVERLLAESERARADAEKARERISGLQALTAALSTAATEAQIADAIAAHSNAVLGAVGTVVARLTTDGTELELLRASDMPEAIEASWQRFPLSAAVPLADVARTNQPLFIESRTEWRSRYPDLEPLLEATGHHANIVMPLAVGERVLGALGAAFDAPRQFDEDDRTAALAFARQCSQALERARLLESERAARQEAESASSAKSQFLAVMSHELRTPLNAIAGYADLLEMGIRGPVTPEQVADLRRIQRAQRHLAGLVTEVLNYVRIETGRVEYHLASVAIGPILHDLEVLIAPQVAAKRITYQFEPCDPTLVVHADAERVTQILVNLATNALKFTGDGGQIVVSVEVEAARVFVRVRDTGVGIETDKLASIFEPFVQVDPLHTRTNEGVGLGLTISRDLARGMGGDLTVDSAPGVGSTFSLELPRSI